MCRAGVVAQQSEVWFLDRSLRWHFLTSTFTSYYRLMITHLGLPEWQYAFTPYGPSPQAKVARRSVQPSPSVKTVLSLLKITHWCTSCFFFNFQFVFEHALSVKGKQTFRKNQQDLFRIYKICCLDKPST